jgi:hypothetical protein
VSINNRVDRVWIRESYLPNLVGSVLYIGVAGYTQEYYKLVPKSDFFYTMDIDGDLAKYGAPGRHLVGDFMELNKVYDNVSIYGIIGHSTFSNYSELKNLANGEVDGAFSSYLQKVHQKLDELVSVGGTLMIGNQITGYSNKAYWRKLFTNDPVLSKYTTIVSDVEHVDSNYIWWGRKK